MINENFFSPRFNGLFKASVTLTNFNEFFLCSQAVVLLALRADERVFLFWAKDGRRRISTENGVSHSIEPCPLSWCYCGGWTAELLLLLLRATHPRRQRLASSGLLLLHATLRRWSHARGE